jgi:hypothetical protein
MLIMCVPGRSFACRVPLFGIVFFGDGDFIFVENQHESLDPFPLNNTEGRSTGEKGRRRVGERRERRVNVC